MMSKLVSFSCVLCLIVACTKSEFIITDTPVISEERTYPKADEALWPYFRSFEDEALLRGKRFDLNRLKINGFINKIQETGVAGYCEYGSHIENEIVIDSDFWTRASERAKEFVVYHELGHCVLMRDHREAQSSNGICLSIMRSGVGTCKDNYNSQTRSLYLDELFELSNN